MGHAAAIIDKDTKERVKQALGYDRISEKTARIILLVSQGIALESAYRMVMNKELTCKVTKSDLKAKSEKFLLNSPQMQKLAHKAVKETLQMKPIETEKGLIYPRVSDRLAAASMVTERTEPKKSETGQGSINLFIDKLQVNQFQTLDIVAGSQLDNGPDEECILINDLDD